MNVPSSVSFFSRLTTFPLNLSIECIDSTLAFANLLFKTNILPFFSLLSISSSQLFASYHFCRDFSLSVFFSCTFSLFRFLSVLCHFYSCLFNHSIDIWFDRHHFRHKKHSNGTIHDANQTFRIVRI